MNTLSAMKDAAASDSSFRRNRLFIWAMPLLGFVGTVYGVAAGISGFAAFLTGSNVKMEAITGQIGTITEGLAVAFMCTLLGLLTAGLAAFPSLMVERKEEEVLGEIDELVEDRLLSRMPSAEAQKAFPVRLEKHRDPLPQSLASRRSRRRACPEPNPVLDRAPRRDGHSGSPRSARVRRQGSLGQR